MQTIYDIIMLAIIGTVITVALFYRITVAAFTGKLDEFCDQVNDIHN
jgi:hypothetical protein